MTLYLAIAYVVQYLFTPDVVFGCLLAAAVLFRHSQGGNGHTFLILTSSNNLRMSIREHCS